MRVVFDTNIFVSAVALPRGRAEQALLHVVSGKDLLIVSKPIIDELLTVVARKFSRDREELARLACFISELGEVVHPELKSGTSKMKPTIEFWNARLRVVPRQS